MANTDVSYSKPMLLSSMTNSHCYRLWQTHTAVIYSQTQTQGCYITSQKASLAPSQRQDTFQDSHLFDRILFKIATFVFNFFDSTLPPYLSSCLYVYTPSHTLYSSSVEKKQQLFPVQNGNSRALVTACSLFRHCLSGTVCLPTPDTVTPCHSSKLPLRPSSSLLPSSSYLDPLDNLRFSFPHRLLMNVFC